MNDSGSARTVLSHAAGNVLYKLEQNQLKIAAMHYHRRGETTLRVFMGTQGKVEETGRPETFNETADREFKSEALEIVSPFEVAREIKSLVYWQLCADDRSKERDPRLARLLHLKGFRALRLVRGELRKHRAFEHEGDPDKEEILEPPRWYEVSELWHKMDDVRGASPFPHKKAVAGTIHKLVALPEYKHLSFRYGNLMEHTAHIVKVVEEDAPLVLKYIEALDLEKALHGK
ncbi:MAG TPA: hypothetical protein VJI33_00615 [Candidatus Paceibacterota bacterium]